jgi:peptidoglycan/LPS O-acetylase OafA/YrhL
VLPVLMLHVGVNSLPQSDLLLELTRGWYGVDLFFVLSGFLITRILLAELDETGTIGIARFYQRRVLRLGPAYVSMLLAVLVGAAIFDQPALQRVPRVLPSIVTYTYNYQIAAGGEHFDVLVIIWSLCVEEQFYLLWPWILRRTGARRGLWFCVSAVAALSMYRTLLYILANWGHLRHPSPASSIWIYFATDTRIGVIMIGCAAALLLHDKGARRAWHWMRNARFFPALALAATCLCVVFVTGGRPSSASWRSATLGYSLAGCMVAVLLAAILAQPLSPIARILSWRPLVSLGAISYGVYLFHSPIAWLVLRSANDAGWLGLSHHPVARFSIAVVLVFALTSTVASLHYRYVERRFMSLRSHWRSQPAAAAASQIAGAPSPAAAKAAD